jgi:hypothetical protein
MESCPICQKVYSNWDSHVRGIGHQEAQVRRNQEREALHNRREAPRTCAAELYVRAAGQAWPPVRPS